MQIEDIYKKYSTRINRLDLELLIAAAIKKPREFVLAHPEYKLTNNQQLKTNDLLARRRRGEPLAYIFGQKEFYGLNFGVNRHTLIPRPETELIVEEAVKKIQNSKFKIQDLLIIDIGTGSGNIIISLAEKLKHANKFIATDISEKALRIARQNAKFHKVDKKIKFIKGNLLEPLLKSKKYSSKTKNIFIVANLPYLSEKIYASASRDVKKYEPRSALLGGKDGLLHYEKLLKQIRILKQRCSLLHVSCFMEISPEQKKGLLGLLESSLPDAKIDFYRDLSGKWRLGIIYLN